MKTKIEIKNRWFGTVLFTYEKENNTIKDTLLEAIKSEADLNGADLNGANLRGAYLYGADLYGADLRGANLYGAYLYGANLRGADLRGANLYGANLRGADLNGADLNGADLRGAYLYGANLRGAYIYVDNCEINEKEEIANFEKNIGIKITKSYINHDIIPTRWSAFWRNGLIIREWEFVEKETKELTVEEISNLLGYEVKVVK